MKNLVQAQLLKGFHDSLPRQEIFKRFMIDKLGQVFDSFGFVPIDTPALEYTDILLGKGGGETEKQTFRFQDNGGRDVAMRFDLTIPFARFMAMNHARLVLPFKRYHMAKVWRGEKPQKGRYREFYQCDFDIVGVDSFSADLEVLLVVVRALEKLCVKNFLVSLNHRGIFNRFLEREGLQEHAVNILRIVDKWAKVGEEGVKQLLMFLPSDKIGKILTYINADGSFLEILSVMEFLAGGEGRDTQNLKTLWNTLKAFGLENRFRLDPSITRGLDYYTGLVFETFLSHCSQMGSICSGGRYNDLTSLYTNKELPGVGGSIGLDRLLVALELLGNAKLVDSKTQVLLLHQEEGLVGNYHRLAQELREYGVVTEVFLERKNLTFQYKYAEAKGIPFVISLASPDVVENNGLFQLKDIRVGAVYEKQTLASAVAKILDVNHKIVGTDCDC